MKTVLINTPIKPHQRKMMEEAAAGRCNLLFEAANADNLPQVQAIIGSMDAKKLPLATQLDWFHLVWAGTDKYWKEVPMSVRFTNGTGAYGPTIAEHMMACMLSLVRQLPHYAALQRQHSWDPAWQERTLEGRTVLILGTGDIGSALAKRLRGFDCTIWGIRRHVQPTPGFDEVFSMEQLDELLPKADVVACALPGTSQTARLLSAERLCTMKQDSILVNCGRGSLIDLNGLVKVLQEGRLLGCGLDVTDPEPLPADSPLWDMDNVIITPHISGATYGHVQEMEDRSYALAAENLRRYLEDEPLLNPVDRKTGYRQTEET